MRFHDGRALTARDVRYSFERILANEQSQGRGVLSPVRGATAVMTGTTTELAGLQLVSPNEFTVELERQVSFFPA